MDRGYLRFKRNFYIKVKMPKAKWQKKIKANRQKKSNDWFEFET